MVAHVPPPPTGTAVRPAVVDGEPDADESPFRRPCDRGRGHRLSFPAAAAVQAAACWHVQDIQTQDSGGSQAREVL